MGERTQRGLAGLEQGSPGWGETESGILVKTSLVDRARGSGYQLWSMGVTRDLHSETGQVQEVSEKPTGSGSRASPNLLGEKSKHLLSIQQRKGEMARRGRGLGSPTGCTRQSQYFAKCSVCNQKQALCKQVSFYSPWYFSFVFLERFSPPQLH